MKRGPACLMKSDRSAVLDSIIFLHGQFKRRSRRDEMAMAAASLVAAPSTAALSGPACQIGCKSEQADVGRARANCRAVNAIAADGLAAFSASSSSSSSSCGGSLQVSCGRRNSRLAWKSSSQLFGLGGCGCHGSRPNARAPGKLPRGGSVRISAEKIDPTNGVSTFFRSSSFRVPRGSVSCRISPAFVWRLVQNRGHYVPC